LKFAINDGTLRSIDNYDRRLSILNKSSISGMGVWVSEIFSNFSNFQDGLSELEILLDKHEIEVVEINFIKTLFQKKWNDGPLEEAKQICDTAAALNCPLITVATFCDSMDYEIGPQSLRQLADFAHDYGLKVAVEFLPWTGVPNLHSAARLLEDCGRDNVGILLDTFHFFESGGRPDDLSKVGVEKIFHVHVNDYPDASLDSDSAETLSLIEKTRNYRCMPGMGGYDLRGFLNQLKMIGYDGWISLEVLNPAISESDLLFGLPRTSDWLIDTWTTSDAK